MSLDDTIAKLTSSKSAERRRAAKSIGKERLPLGPELLAAFRKEQGDKRTWETQTEMISALGLIDEKECLPDINKIIERNIPHDMITMAAAGAYVRLARADLQDAGPVIHLTRGFGLSVFSGALRPLAEDRMVPPPEQITEILQLTRDSNRHPDRVGSEFGLMDPRCYVVLACANWDPALTTDFLHHCIESAVEPNRFGKPVRNENLVSACKNSLQGKPSKGYFL